MTATLRVGTRGSALARRQTALVIEALQAVAPDTAYEIVIISTEGDRRLDVSLEQVGGQGVFVKEIEQRLIEGEIDVAVHSLKDMPAVVPSELVIAAVPRRADPRDVLVAREGRTLDALPEGARIGSDSNRRVAQLRAQRPDLRFEGIRGNVDTRLRKVDEGEYDAVALAAAGLDRLGLLGRATQVFETSQVLPAPGQGALAVQCRAADAATAALLGQIDDAAARAATEAERAFLLTLGAGCRLPVGAHATVEGETVHMRALLADDAGALHYGDAHGPTSAASHMGQSLARRLRIEAKA